MRILDSIINFLIKINNKKSEKNSVNNTKTVSEKPLYKPNLNPKILRKDEIIRCEFCKKGILVEEKLVCDICGESICIECSSILSDDTVKDFPRKNICDNCIIYIDEHPEYDFVNDFLLIQSNRLKIKSNLEKEKNNA